MKYVTYGGSGTGIIAGYMVSPLQPESAHLQKLGAAAAEEVRKTVRSALTELLANFMFRLPGELLEQAPKASNPADRTALSDLARSLPAKSQAWVNTFAQKVDQQLIGGLDAARASDAESPGGIDDSIALASVELRAEERYQKQITELDARFNRVRLMVYVPVYSKALAPAGLCRSLQDTADAMQWPPRQRRLLLEKFDAIVVPQLERLYRALIVALTRISTEAAKSVEADKSIKPLSAPKAAAPRAPQTATTIQAPADQKHLDLDSIGMLQRMAMKSEGDGYHDGLLAADLLALAENKPLPGVMQDQNWIPIQRISLAGHFLNVVIGDALVPDELKPQHESVRFPLMKSALTDDTLFTSKTHPLGSLIHELLLKSATSRITGNVETRRMAELLQQVLVQFDLAPEFVRQAMRGSTPIQDSQIQRFFELQRQQAQQRRDFVIAEAKRVVVHELEQATFGRNIPAPAIRFLNVAWGPLLTKRLLQHGADSPMWKAALAQMEKLLDMLEARRPGEAPTAEWTELLQAMSQVLVAEGMAQDKVNAALQALEQSRTSQVVEGGLAA
ncbi:MAG TPA: DUF1631 family protein [Verrucomicrobiae bacterium]|nr:DUF1631 family protein [Verrucomicrobiae bacterium]